MNEDRSHWIKLTNGGELQVGDVFCHYLDHGGKWQVVELKHPLYEGVAVRGIASDGSLNDKLSYTPYNTPNVWLDPASRYDPQVVAGRVKVVLALIEEMR